MNANARTGNMGKCLAALLLAAMPMGAAHAVGLVEESASAQTAAEPQGTATTPAADCLSVDGETLVADATAETCPEPAEGSSGGAAGMEQVPRWKTLLPGALR